MSTRTGVPLFSSVAIIGVGLIGGSIAAALKLRGIAGSVVGVGRNRVRLNAAREAGIIDDVATDIEAVDRAALVVVCTPVDRIVEDIRRAAALGPGTLITDAGSVKACIVNELRGALPEGTTFVGSHPMAGSEKTGWENGRADLFVDRLCVLTPDGGTDPGAIAQVDAFWQSLGMRTLQMSAEDHDRAVAVTSHLPHLTAAAVVSLIDEFNAPLASTGFGDLTRIAGGDPSLWVAILQRNRTAITAGIDALVDQLAAYRQALSEEDIDALRELLSDAKRRRDSLDL